MNPKTNMASVNLNETELRALISTHGQWLYNNAYRWGEDQILDTIQRAGAYALEIKRMRHEEKNLTPSSSPSPEPNERLD